MEKEVLFRAVGYYHVIEAQIENGRLFIGEYEEVYGTDRDEIYRNISVEAMASALGVSSGEQIMQILREKGRTAFRFVGQVLRENDIAFVHHLH